jgi:hypothetical protein
VHTPVQYVKCTYTQCTNRTVPYGIHIDNLKVQMSTSGVDPLEIDFDSLRPGIKKSFLIADPYRSGSIQYI